MERTVLLAELLWIPRDLGGRASPPFPGMRPGIRFQRRDFFDRGDYRDAELITLVLDSDGSRSQGKIAVRSDGNQQPEALVGELFELLDAFQVIAVGRVVAISE